MPAFHTPTETPLELRQLVVPLVVLGAVAVFVFRLWQLQIVHGDDYREKARRSAERTVNTLAPRGEIYDRQGRLVAGVRSAWVIRAVPSVILKEPKKGDTHAKQAQINLLNRVSKILVLPTEEIQRRLKQGANPALPTDVLVNATAAQAIKIAEQPSLFPGFEVQVRAIREVVEPFAVTHVLGYVGKPSQSIIDELEAKDIKPADYVGRDGIEKVYEAELMGKVGSSRMAVDSRGRPIQQVSSQSPIPGSQLYLSLDLDLQREALRQLGKRKGAIAAIDPRNGDVLAFVSSPTYDLSLFDGGISQADYSKLQNDPRKPFQKRPSQGLYSPGSTFKIVTALAAARKGLLPGHVEHCPGYKMVGNRRIKCGNHSPGITQTFASAFRTSCNTYFIDLALEAGPEAISQAAKDLGLGLPTGIDLPSESGGVIPSGLEVKEFGGKARPWYQGDTANMGIGQGGVLVTPLQMAQLVMRVADRGHAPLPRLVRAIKESNEAFPRELEPVMAPSFEAPDAYWTMVKDAMGTVISSGTARRAQIDGLVWGGKTGSTEHSRSNRTHSWFVGMAPLDNPRIVIAVLTEEAGHGGEVSAPIAAGVVRKFLQVEEAKVKDSASSIALRKPSNSSRSF